MTTQPEAGPSKTPSRDHRVRSRRLFDSQQRLSTGDQCILVGGSAETHAEMLETMLRLESELERLGQGLADVTPYELAEIAWRIDSPELHQIALSLGQRPVWSGRTFHESSAEELTELSSGNGLSASADRATRSSPPRRARIDSHSAAGSPFPKGSAAVSLVTPLGAIRRFGRRLVPETRNRPLQ